MVLVASVASPRASLVGDTNYTATRVVGEDFPKRLLDPTGLEHQLTEPPQRIVSTVLAADELLSELSDIEQIVGVTFLTDDEELSNVVGHYPNRIARVSTKVEPLLALDPDLVIVASFTQADVVRLLLAADVPVLRLEEHESFEQVFSSLRLLASVLGTSEKAEAIEARSRERIRSVRERVAGTERLRVLVWGASGYTKGRDTLMHEVIELAGGLNAAAEAGIVGDAQISEELAISLAPEVILLDEGGGGPIADPMAYLIQHNAAWRNVPAVKAGRVYDHSNPWSSTMTQYRVRDLEEADHVRLRGASPYPPTRRAEFCVVAPVEEDRRPSRL